jgi:hypothetical protein
MSTRVKRTINDAFFAHGFIAVVETYSSQTKPKRAKKWHTDVNRASYSKLTFPLQIGDYKKNSDIVTMRKTTYQNYGRSAEEVVFDSSESFSFDVKNPTACFPTPQMVTNDYILNLVEYDSVSGNLNMKDFFSKALAKGDEPIHKNELGSIGEIMQQLQSAIATERPTPTLPPAWMQDAEKAIAASVDEI